MKVLLAVSTYIEWVDATQTLHSRILEKHIDGEDEMYVVVDKDHHTNDPSKVREWIDEQLGAKNSEGFVITILYTDRKEDI